MSAASGKYNANDQIYIVCRSSVFIKQLNLSGPIISPYKVQMSKAYQIICSGVELHQYDPVTRRYAKMTVQNAFNKDKFYTEAEVKVTSAAPANTPIAPVPVPVSKEETEEPTVDEAPVDTEAPAEEPVPYATIGQAVIGRAAIAPGGAVNNAVAPSEEAETVSEETEETETTDSADTEAPAEQAAPTASAAGQNKKKKKK